jgi:hypothetical protein
MDETIADGLFVTRNSSKRMLPAVLFWKLIAGKSKEQTQRVISEP